MHGCRFRQPFQIITAFQQADDPVRCVFIRHLQKPARRPVEILSHQIDLRERIAVMRVETGRDENEIRRKIRNRRQHARFEGLAKMLATGIGRKRRVDDVVLHAGFVLVTAPRVKRHLVGGAEQHGCVVPEDILRTVAVMHVPVDDGDTLRAVRLLRMAGGNRHIVEQTETHGLGGLGMVAGRAGCDEDVVGGTGKHVIHGRHGGADAGQRSLKAFGGEIGVGLDPVDLTVLFGNLPHHGKKMLFRMGQQHRVFIRLRRFLPVQPLEIRMFKRDVQRPQAVWPLGMAGRRDMLKEDRMFVKSGRHSFLPETSIRRAAAEADNRPSPHGRQGRQERLSAHRRE
ncbi:hypothetical protein AT6N2_C1719 [Agrobacterium tumefaciens]|nr:hypothetical protein AT6N2_C1719 [Agrobacterium tumefaciens]